MSTAQNSAKLTETLQTKFDFGIWYTLFNWPSLTVAVQNQWGGPDSSGKRDWLAGQVSELFNNDPQTDAEDVEILLLQVLEDEFDVRLEDDTEVGVARELMAIWKEVGEGSTELVDALERRYQGRGGREVVSGSVSVREQNQEGEWDSVDEESEEEDEDVAMGDAPALVPVKPKPEPDVDEEGFTKVLGRKRK